MSSAQIRTLVLYTLPYHVMKYITNTFISHLDPPIIPSSHNTIYASINTQCVSHFFTLQPMPATIQWKNLIKMTLIPKC